MVIEGTNSSARIPVLLRGYDAFLAHHDLLRLSQIWRGESSLLPLNLRHDRSHIGHGSESLWHRPQIDVCGRKPIRLRLHILVRSCCRRLHRHTDELPQQSTQRFSTVHVSSKINVVPEEFSDEVVSQCESYILRHIHHCRSYCFVRPLSGLQHH